MSNPVVETLQKYIDQEEIAGAAVRVHKDGEMIVNSFLGWADIESRMPVHDRTVFRLCSMSKPITAVLGMTLVEKGELDLEAPVKSILPVFSHMPDLTVRMLFDHSSGILTGESSLSFRPVAEDTLEEHIARKKAIYERYRDGLADLPVTLNPFIEGEMEPNYWLSCLLIDEEAMCEQTRTATTASYVDEAGKACPTEILEKLAAINAEGRPIWKPMHLQPIYKDNAYVTADGLYEGGADVGSDIFNRGLCLPCDIKMTAEEQDIIIAAIRECFE